MFLLFMLLWNEDMAVAKGYTSYPGQHCLFCDDYNHAHLVWFCPFYPVSGPRYQILYKQWTGNNWINEYDLSLRVGNILANYPSIAGINKNGTLKIYAVWESNSLYSDIILREFLQDTWSDKIYVSQGTKYTYTPSIICDTAGNLHIVYEKNFEICYRKYDGASLWEEKILSNSGVYAAYPSIASFNNKLFVVWQDLRDGNFEIYFKEFDGINWLTEKRLTHSTGASIFPNLCVDSSGVIHIVYQEDTLGGYRIFYIMGQDTNFSDPILIIDSPGEAITPSITYTRDSIHIVWSDSRTGNYEIYYKKLASDSIERLTKARGISAYPTITNDKDGNLYLVFWDNRDDTNKVYFKENKRVKKGKQSILFATPNPFIVQTRIFSDSDIQIYDMLGRLVATLKKQNNIIWQGKDKDGKKLNSGIYFLKNNNSLYKVVFLSQ